MFRILAVVLSITVGSTMPAFAKRVALVIGNSAYTSAVALPNPVNDAAAMTAKLQGLGFEVVSGYDLDLMGMRKTVAQFARATKGADIALMFFAGHGMQVAGENYLIPIDARFEDETALDFETMSVNFVVRQMTNDVKVQMVFLDACRNNPLARSLARRMGPSRSLVGEGLAEIKLHDTGGEGSVVAYATSPGEVALDGDGINSPFTNALLRHIDAPNASIQTVMTRVTGDVYRETEQRQRPWVNASLIGEVFLNKTTEVAALPPEATPGDVGTRPAHVPATDPLVAWQREKATWDAADGTRTSAAYETYIRSYPTGTFAAIAKEKIAMLSRGPSSVPPVGGNVPQITAQEKQTPGTQFTEYQLGWDRNTRKEVQARLNLSDFNVGRPDGAIGPKTRAGLGAWQSANGFIATGFFTQPQYNLLSAQTQVQYVEWQKQQQIIAANNRTRGRSVNRTKKKRGKSGGGISPAGAAFLGGAIGGVIGGVLRR